MKYSLGIDLGIASIGWAVYNLDNPNIIDYGVRLFDAAEHPKTKESLATPRRIARGMRRTIRRRSYRMNAIKQLIIRHHLITSEQINNLYSSTQTKNKHLYDTYYLRYNALTCLSSNEELSKILIHLSKHRGFKSNRKKDKSIDGKINNSLEENSQILQNHRTVGEMLHLDKKFTDKKRNGSGTYNVMIQRADITKEAILILETQRSLGNKLVTQEFIDKYLTILNWQKHFDWGGNIVEMVGSCQFEPNEKRAPKSCFTSEKFIALSKLNNIVYTTDTTENKLLPDEIQQIINLALTRSTKTFNITFATIRTILKLPNNAKFNYVRYKNNDEFAEIEKNTKIKELEFKGFHELRTAIESHINKITWSNIYNNIILLDNIAYALTYNKTDDEICNALTNVFKNKQHNFAQEETKNIIDAILNNGITFDKNINLSLKVLYKIIPHLESGITYDKACLIAGYNHSQQNNDKHHKLPSIQSLGIDQELTNPVVIRAIGQTRKVINALIDKHGLPYQINIELARDIGKSAKQRGEIDKINKENNENNEKLYQEFTKLYSRTPAKDELLKFKLCKQQGWICIYSGIKINPAEILNGSNATQIDHIIPYSRCFDDSLSNKVLCLTGENQRKGNQTPFEYIGQSGHNPLAWHNFEEHCQSMNKNGYKNGFTYKKLELLLLKKFEQDKFIERNLNDTRYIAKFCMSYIKNHLKFSDDSNKDPVKVITGQATAFIRNHWGLRKSREENDLHHAQDACVIAVTTTSMQQKITSFMRARDYGKNYDATYTDPNTGEIFNHFPEPYKNFRNDIIDKISKVFVSRMPKRSIGGAVHDDTIRSSKYYDDPQLQYANGKKFSTVNKPLVTSEIKIENNEIKKLCPTYKLNNPNIYNLLYSRLEQHGNDCKKAFAEPLYAPRKDGSPSDILIKTVKITQVQNSGVMINHGVANSATIVRVDIFHKGDKNYIVPIYLADTIKKELPDRAITAGKIEADWEVMDNTYQFMFSLYPNDFVNIISKKEEVSGYYIGVDRGTGMLSIKSHCGSKTHRRGIKINTIIKKYNIDILGNKTNVEQETRQLFSAQKKNDFS